MALRLPKNSSSDDRYTVWVRVVERIYTEQVSQGWRHKMFRLIRAVFNNNKRLSNQGGFLLNWMAENYVDASLMVIRRELDIQDGTENLRNLLEDIIKYQEVLTRARYVGQWPPDEVYFANRAFDRYNPVKIPGSPNTDYINPMVVKNDLELIDAEANRLRIYAERTRAHRTQEQGIDNSITFKNLHDTIINIRSIVGKYYGLLTLKSVAEWEPVAQFNIIVPFTKAWVTNVAAITREINEERNELTK